METMNSQVGVYGLATIAAILLITISWYAWRELNKSRHQRHIIKVLESLGVKYLRDVVLPDGIEGLAFIDYLLLVPNGVVVLDINYSEGHLFGGDSVDQWTQVVNSKTYKFDNPLYANQAKCQAVLWNMENNICDENNNATDHWKVHGWIVFSNAGNFPKGIPSHVSMIDDLKNDLVQKINLTETVNEESLKIWNKLHNLSITTRAEASR